MNVPLTAHIELKNNLGIVEVHVYPTYIQKHDEMEYIAVEPYSEVHSSIHTTFDHALMDLADKLVKHYESIPKE